VDPPESKKRLGHVGVYTNVRGLCVTLLIVDVYTLRSFEPFLLRYAKFTMRTLLITEINGRDMIVKTNLSKNILHKK
jgi:hypothetical protein